MTILLFDIGAVTDATCRDTEEGPLKIVIEGEMGDVRFTVPDVDGARRLLHAMEAVVDFVNDHDTALQAWRRVRQHSDAAWEPRTARFAELVSAWDDREKT